VSPKDGRDAEEIADITRTLVEVWGSEEQAYSDLQTLTLDYNRELFEGKLPQVVIGVVTRWVLAGPLGTSANAGANYNPASSGLHPAIYLGKSAIASRSSILVYFLLKSLGHRNR
jgi:hypothetical protein